ncbi:hypothetical protein CDAR_537951 [Caerostris darwini]|uniref:Uncharacterized protein n=1 Tax=Caerostris darwini TaxID=1538125 RepID=A0AAV4SAW2_9ARAC|nr:hypothetical protein CDAR_537951 [Caerostris darwini]
MSQASSGILEDAKDFEMETEFTTKDNNNTENNDYSDAPLITDLTDEFILFNQAILSKRQKQEAPAKSKKPRSVANKQSRPVTNELSCARMTAGFKLMPAVGENALHKSSFFFPTPAGTTGEL